MSKRCIVVAGGECYDEINLITANDYVIAADSGLYALNNANIVPNLIVGDFDSYDGNFPDGVKVIKLPSKKDDTDLLFALKKAVEMNFDEYIVLGGYGSRPDQNFAMYQSLLWVKNNNNISSVSAVSSEFSVHIIKNEKKVFDVKENEYLSVFAVESKAENVSILGAEYPLENATIQPDFPIGVSNQTKVDNRVTVSVEIGALIVFIIKKNI